MKPIRLALLDALRRRALAVLLLGSALALPAAAHAATPNHNAWYSCRLTTNGAGGIVSHICDTIPMTRPHRARTGWKITRTKVAPRTIHSVRFPIFAPPAPLYSLPGCPASIAQWAGYIVPAAREYGIPVAEMTGVMWIESKGYQYAYNPSSGAAGLYQFLPSTAASLGINPYDPYQATFAAARYIRDYGLGSFSGGGYYSAWLCD